MDLDTGSSNEPSPRLINDITQLNPIEVHSVITPKSIEEIVDAIKSHDGSISIGGGRYSMGGQIATENSLHIDMREMNQIIHLDTNAKTITIQAGCIWRDIQEMIDPHDLSIKIMQTYSNFTVGGSLSVNAHGRYIGLGPLVLSVLSIKMVMAKGKIIDASPTKHSDIFYGAIGGYGGLGVIVEATLSLADNIKISRHSKLLNINEYYDYFCNNIKDPHHAIFHNADLYPPQYKKARLVTWFETYEPVNVEQRLIPKQKSYPLQQYFIWAVSETYTGKWRRQLYIDPLFYLFKKVVWRNYEASYSVAELEPSSRTQSTYVLQEYFIPVEQITHFVEKMGKILRRYKVNTLNISIRHAKQDPGTLLAWAPTEVFAFVMYYKERINSLEKNIVPIWTRELIEAAISCGGRYYLPYQPHATKEQFLRAYQGAPEYFLLKKKVDPKNIFRNKLWDKYYMENNMNEAINDSEFKEVFLNAQSRDAFYLFLQNVYNIYPENPFHLLITQQVQKYNTDQEIYEAIQRELPKIKGPLNDLRYALPALFKQKKEMAKQTLVLFPNDKPIDGYVEIGSNGRYISHLKKHYDISNIIYIHDLAQSYSPVDIAERGSIQKYGQFIPFNNYDKITEDIIKSNSIDLVTSYIGLHHCPKDKLDNFIRSIHRILKPGGAFIIRDHDVKTSQMNAFVSLAHTVFNAGLGLCWEENQKELRYFDSLDNWISYLEQNGFKTDGQRLLQEYDPSLNTLIKFVKST